MCSFRCVLVALFLFAGMIDAAGQPKLSAAQQEVINAHEARTEASNKRDQVAYSRYVADDCIFSTDDGLVITKAQLMAHVGKFPTEYDHSVNPRDYLVHVYGDTAVLNLRYTTHEQFTDSDIVSEMRMTETYIKQDGRWLLIARHWAKIPTNFRKPVAVDISIYKDYVGQYEWRPLDDVETISLKDGKLWTQSGSGAPEEFFPLGADSFFLRNELGTNIFIRDPQGHVTGYTYQDADGQEVHVKKIR
jgi:ketosteroid isomerase-like protein